MSWRELYDWYPPKSPIPAPVAGKERRKFGMTWWGRQWIETVERCGEPRRMCRGRAYARADMVYDIKLMDSAITAKVKGNYSTYKISVATAKLKEGQWKSAITAMKESNALGAILNNELPEDIDTILGLPLIEKNLKAKCSCPDSAMPCKHIAALYYVLADEIDKAPQILFALRGVDKDTLFKTLLDETTQRPRVPRSSNAKKSKVKQKKNTNKKSLTSPTTRKKR